MIENTIKAVIFDMDGLMLDTESIYKSAWQAAARSCGFEIPDALYARFTGRAIPDCEEMLLPVLAKERPDVALAAALASLMDDFRERRRALWMAHIEDHGIERKKGLAGLLKYLSGSGIRRSIATSTGREDALLCLGDLRSEFEAMTNGPEVSRGKPAPDIFELALRRTGLDASECLALEDSEAGVASAHAAGLRVIMVPDLTIPTAAARQRAWRVCEDLHQVREILASGAAAST